MDNMRRIISGIVLVGLLVPSFLGAFVDKVNAQSTNPPPIDCTLNPLDPTCINGGAPTLTLANTPECNFLAQEQNVKNPTDLSNEITRTKNAASFIDANLPKLIQASEYFNNAINLPKTQVMIPPSGPGGRPSYGYAQDPAKVEALKQQGIALVNEFNTAYGSAQVNIDPDDRGGLLGYFFTIDKTSEQLKINADQAISRLTGMKYQFEQENQRAQICQEQSTANPDQAKIDDLRQQQNDSRQAEQNAQTQEQQQLNEEAAQLKEELKAYEECHLIPFNLSVCVRDAFLWILKWLVRTSAFILFYVSQLFNWIIKISILDFKSVIDGGGNGGVQGNGLAVMVLWKTFRDIANMMAIFVLLYIAGSTILQLNSIDTQKTISWLIIVALLINFSAVFTRIAIDTSNVIALTFYSRFAGADGSEPNIAGAFTKAQGLDILMGQAGQGGDSVDDQSASIAKSLGILIAILVTIFVLLMSAGFFIVRMVSLILLIITSPLAFIGYVVPWIKSQVTDKWWVELKAQLTFAPVFMGLLYITLSLAQGAKNVKFVDTTNNTIGTAVMYAMITMMMFACLTIARSSAKGVASSKFKSLGLGSAALAGAGVGLLGANTLGRFGQWRVESGKGGKWANRLARATYNPYTFTAGNVFKAEKKVTDVLSGKGGEIKNKSFRDAQQSADKAKKEKAKARVDEHKYNMKSMSTDAEKAKYIASISNEDERKELYKELTVSERGKYEAAAKTAGDTTTEGRLKELRDKLKDDDQEKTDKAYNQANRSIATKNAKELLSNIVNAGAPGTAARTALIGTLPAPFRNIADLVNTIGPSEIIKISREKTVMDAILSDPEVNSNFTPAFLAKINKSLLDDDFISARTVTKLYSDLYTPPPTPPATLTAPQKALNDWFDINTHFR